MEESCFARVPQSRDERWRVLETAVADWFPALSASDGFSRADLLSAERRLEISLPEALCEWFRLAGKRVDIWSRQDCFLPPAELGFLSDYLVFYIENQTVVHWGIRLSDLGLVDPPVYVQSGDEDDVWIQQNPSISEFALQMFVFCIEFGWPLRWVCGFPDQQLSETIQQEFPALGFPEWSWTGSTLYGFRDIIVDVQEHGHTHVAARTDAAFRKFTGLATPGNFDIAASWEDR